MSPGVLAAYQEFQPAEKACWEILLREHEVGRRIPSDVLNRAMDQTLEQLWALLGRGTRATEASVREMVEIRLPGTEEGACAFETYLPYFASGEEALELVGKEIEWLSPRVRGEGREELRLAFDLLVQCQLQRLCGACALSVNCPHGGPGALHVRERREGFRRPREERDDG
jgi:hypothetical protein